VHAVILGLSGDAGAGKDTVADALVAHHGFVKIALADPLKRFLMATFDFSKETLWGPSKLRAIPDKRFPREHGPWVSEGLPVHCACCGYVRNSDEAPPSCYLTPRYALQSLGTGWGRKCYLDVWVDLALRDVERLLRPRTIVSGMGMESESACAECCYESHLGVYATDKLAPRWEGVVIPDMRYFNEMQKAKLKGAFLVRVKRFRTEEGELRVRPTEHWRAHSSETEQGDLPDDYFDVRFENTGPVSEVPALAGRLVGRLRDEPLDAAII
jgi:hypothetical protein